MKTTAELISDIQEYTAELESIKVSMELAGTHLNKWDDEPDHYTDDYYHILHDLEEFDEIKFKIKNLYYKIKE